MANFVFSGLILFQIFVVAVHTSLLYDNSKSGSFMEDLSGKLSKRLNDLSNVATLQTLYQAAEPRMTVAKVNGDKLVAEIAQNIANALGNKMTALNRSVQFAEELAMNATWDPTLKIGDVNYTAAKKINGSDPHFQYSPQFLQNVNFDTTSVHIPVEIYEGDINILNGLKWTARLEEIFYENRKNDPNLLWQYMGTQSGIMRNYPASKWKGQGVDLYDVRRRPWYTQGASSPKDMIILIDTSGSSHGQALSLTKLAVRSLLSTLSEDDYVNVASFSSKAEWAGCFPSLVQANHRNKEKLREEVDALKADGMADYAKGFEFAFEMFEKFYKEALTDGEGANCNKVIMFFTDGGTDMPQEVFSKYNWPRNQTSNMDDEEKRIWRYKNSDVRIFTYAVGPTANPIAAVRWIACNNRGHFYKIPAMGAIRSTVQAYYDKLSNGIAAKSVKEVEWTSVKRSSMEYNKVLTRPCAMANAKSYLWTNIVRHEQGLGMLTTVTLPVYNRSSDSANQTILGVMGIDATISELEQFIPTRKLGPNGYSFCINSNGYIVFHPALKANNGHLEDPPNVDIAELEHETDGSMLLRRNMIDGETGNASLTGFIIRPDELHLDNVTRFYYYTNIEGTNFSLTVVLPQDTYYVESTQHINITEGMAFLINNQTQDFVAPWNYCGETFDLDNQTSHLDNLLDILSSNASACDMTLVQYLFFDANLTSFLIDEWSQHVPDRAMAAFVATNSGLTRVYPQSAGYYFAPKTDLWNELYYKRTIDKRLTKQDWVFSVHFQRKVPSENDDVDSPLIMISRSFNTFNDSYKPGIVGLLFSQEQLKEFVFSLSTAEPVCGNDTDRDALFVDDAGLLILSTRQEDKIRVGSFLGAFEPELMQHLLDKEVFIGYEYYDYQAACQPDPPQNNSAFTSAPFLSDLLSVKWWTSKLAWAYLNFNLYNWLNYGSDYFVMAEPVVSDPDAEREEEETEEIIEQENRNYSCVKRRVQYRYNRNPEKLETTESTYYGDCVRHVGTTYNQNFSMVFITVQRCETLVHEEDLDPRPIIPMLPVKSGDPGFTSVKGEQCNVTHRYRRRPPCYDRNENEDASQCGGGSRVTVSIYLLLCLLLTLYN